jgi:hypothetical protein
MSRKYTNFKNKVQIYSICPFLLTFLAKKQKRLPAKTCFGYRLHSNSLQVIRNVFSPMG